MRSIGRAIGFSLRKLELFEFVELVAALLFVILLLVKGQALDTQARVPDWHWRPLEQVGMACLDVLPIGWGVVLVGFLLYSWRKQHSLNRGFSRALAVLRYVLPFCLVMMVYRAVNDYIPILSPVDRDNWLLAADRWMFGTQPSLWLQAYISPHLTDFFSCFYLAWFPSLFVTLLLLLWRSREAATGYMCSVMLAFYIAYLCYMLVPAIGPVYTLADQYTTSLSGGALTVWQDQVVDGQSQVIPHDCFPSLHTGIACVMVFYIGRYWRRLLWVYVPVAAGIMMSTIYLRYHYFTDLIFGIVLAVLTGFAGDKGNRVWRHVRTRLQDRGARSGAGKSNSHSAS